MQNKLGKYNPYIGECGVSVRPPARLQAALQFLDVRVVFARMEVRVKGKPMTKRRGNGEGSIFQRADKRWVATVTIGHDANGKRQRRTVYGKTRGEVQDKLTKLQHEVLSGTICDDGNLKVGEYLSRWLENSARPTVKELTYDSYEGAIRVHISRHIGGVKLAKLSPAHVQGMYSAMEQGGASGHVRLVSHAVLHRALNQAVRWQLVPRNVCDAVDPPKAPKREIQPFTAAESQKLLAEARGERFEALYVLAIMGGFRQGELLGLKWEDIDMEAGTVAVRRTLRVKHGRVIVTSPKSAKGRRLVEMPQMAMDALQDHRKRMMAEGHAGCEWVFCNTAGKAIDKNNLVRRSYKPLLKRAGVPMRRFHDLRHTHATLMLLQGEHPKVVQERMGHATIAMTLDTYSHVMPGMQRDAADRLGNLFSTAIA